MPKCNECEYFVAKVAGHDPIRGICIHPVPFYVEDVDCPPSIWIGDANKEREDGFCDCFKPKVDPNERQRRVREAKDCAFAALLDFFILIEGEEGHNDIGYGHARLRVLIALDDLKKEECRREE